eukprot:tig00020912_g15805.t1
MCGEPPQSLSLPASKKALKTYGSRTSTVRFENGTPGQGRFNGRTIQSALKRPDKKKRPPLPYPELNMSTIRTELVSQGSISLLGSTSDSGPEGAPLRFDPEAQRQHPIAATPTPLPLDPPSEIRFGSHMLSSLRRIVLSDSDGWTHWQQRRQTFLQRKFVQETRTTLTRSLKLVYSPAVELLGSVLQPERWCEWDPFLAKAKNIVDLDANNRLIYLKYRGIYDFLPRDMVCLQTWTGPDEAGSFVIVWRSVSLPQRPSKIWKGVVRAENAGSVMVIQPAVSTSAASLVTYMPCIDWKGYVAPGVAAMLAVHVPLLVAGMSRAVDATRSAASAAPTLASPLDSHFAALFNPISLLTGSPAPSPAPAHAPSAANQDSNLSTFSSDGPVSFGPLPRAPPAGLREYFGVPSRDALLYERAVAALRRNVYQEGHLYLFAGHVAFGSFSGSYRESFPHEVIEAVEKVAPSMDVARSRIRIRHSGGKELVLVSENKRDVVFEAILAAALPKNNKIRTGRL